MATKKQVKEPKAPRNYSGVLGMLQVFVIVSICYSTFVVYEGTQGYAPKVMLIPQALWAALLIVKKFTSTK